MDDVSNKQNVIAFDPFVGFDYTLLPGQCPLGFEKIDFHNRAFRFWREFWNTVFQEISGETVRTEDFFRQDVIGVLTRGDRIAGMLLHSFFHLESEAALVLPYFQSSYKAESLASLYKSGVKTVMSMEYLSVDRDFRRQISGLPVMDVLIGLGYRILLESKHDAMIAPSRRDLKVDVCAAQFGAKPFSDTFIFHDVPVVCIMTRAEDVQQAREPAVRRSIETLWARRQNYSNLILPRSNLKSIRAG